MSLLKELLKEGIQAGQPVPADIKPVMLAEVTSERLEFQVRTCEIHDIQEYLASETGAQLPEELIEKLGYRKLNWRVVHKNDMLPILFIGVNDTKYTGPDFKQYQASGTIVVDRGISVNPDHEVFIKEINVAGTGLDSNRTTRVTAASYSADDRRAVRWDVSVADNEFPSKNMLPPYIELTSYDHEIAAIPTDPFKPFTTAGIVTESMTARTGPTGNRHKRVMQMIDATNNGHLELADMGDLSYECGFTLTKDNLDYLTLSYNPRDYALPGPPILAAQWSISIPGFLQTV